MNRIGGQGEIAGFSTSLLKYSQEHPIPLLWLFVTERPSDDAFIFKLLKSPVSNTKERVPWICWKYFFFHDKLTTLLVSALPPISWEFCCYKPAPQRSVPAPQRSVNSWHTDKFKFLGLKRKKLLEMMDIVITWMGCWFHGCIYICQNSSSCIL